MRTNEETQVKTCYKLEDERYQYSYQWDKSEAAQTAWLGRKDGSVREAGCPWAFNWACRRDPCLLVSGDQPRVALVQRYRIDSSSPPINKLGDLRIRCTVGGKTYLLDEAEHIHTIFHPWGTAHQVSLKPDAPLDVDIRTTLVENRGIAVRVLASTTSDSPVDAEIELIFGGMCQTADVNYMPQSLPHYFIALPEDAKDNVFAPVPGGYTISSSSMPLKTVVLADPAGETHITPADSHDKMGNRAVFKYRLSLTRNPQAIRLVAFEEDAKQPALNVGDIEKYESAAQAYYVRLLSPFEISTPDKTLDAAFYAAVVNFDYAYQAPGWLEGVQYWSCYWTNNNQISAAICLGQVDRARDALKFFADTPVGPCPERYADGTLFHYQHRTPQPNETQNEEGLPYYIEQLYRYWRATGDNETLHIVWDRLVESFAGYWTFRDPEGNLLLNYHLGCNSFLYQADNLSLPGDAASPSIIMTDCLEKMAEMAEARGEKGDADRWRHRAEYMRSELVRRLWSKEDGKFLACIDSQGLPMAANYYTDFVFPQLYSDLPAEYSWISLRTLDRTLWVGDHLMLAGSLKPPVFGNSAVMPTQMAEAAEAYCKAGRTDEGYRLLHGVALAATTYTDSPGAFPEWMSGTGFGNSNYIFGNPIGSFIRGTVAGLFGLERASSDRALVWHPAFPDDWKSAHLKIGDIAMSLSGVQGNRTYAISLPTDQRLDFRIPLHRYRVEKVLDADGREVSYEVIAHPGGGYLQIHAGPAKKHVFHVVAGKPGPVWKLPVQAGPGSSIELMLPEQGMSISDPQGAFADFRIDGDHLKGTLAEGIGVRTFFLHDSRGRNITPVELDFGKSPQRSLPKMLPGKREHLDLNDKFNADAIECHPWNMGLVSLDMAKHVKADNLLHVGDYTFHVRPSGKNAILVEIGKLHIWTNVLELSDKPSSVTLNVGKPVKGLEFLIAFDWRSRTTDMQVGDIKLHYADGSIKSEPLINGYNADSVMFTYAHGIVHQKLDAAKISALSVDADSTRVLDSVEFSIWMPDGSLGILGANTILP